MKHLTLTPSTISHTKPPTTRLPEGAPVPDELPPAKEEKVHLRGGKGGENARLMFVGTATTIL